MDRTKIEEAILKSGLTRTELCKRAGISRASLNSLLRGADAKVSTIERIADILGVSPSEFFSSYSKEDRLYAILNKQTELINTLLKALNP